MKTQNIEAVAEAASIGVDQWQVDRRELKSRIAARFARVEWRRAGDLVAVLMSELPREECLRWRIATGLAIWRFLRELRDSSFDGCPPVVARP